MLTLLIVAEVIVIILLILLILVYLNKKSEKKSGIKFQYLNEKYKKLIHEINKFIILKEKGKKEAKEYEKKEKSDDTKKKYRTYVLDFKGNIAAEEVSRLREEITAILAVVNKEDEIVITVESPGGTVNGYGLAAAQLKRIKDAKIKLTILVDKVAASGGYLMACIGDKIIASPFAYVGSIGVVSEFANYNKVLKKFGVEWKSYTAGESKRTVTPFGKITPIAEKKFKEQMTKIHDLFKHYVKSNRPKVNIKKIATGDHWTALDALKLGLVDKIQTSDEYILEKIKESNVYSIETYKKPEFMEKIMKVAINTLDTKLQEVYNRQRIEF